MAQFLASVTLDQALWMLTAVVIPLVVAGVTKTSTPPWVKGLLATVLSLIDGALVAYFGLGSLTPENVMIFFMTAVGISQTFYGQVFKPLGWTAFLLDNIGPKDPAVLPDELADVDVEG